MYIQTVTFTVKKEFEDKLRHKMQHDLESLAQTPGCLFYDCWVKRDEGEVSCMLLMKWQEKKDMQNWLTRPDHVVIHKEMAAYYKKHPEEKFEMKRESEVYEPYFLS